MKITLEIDDNELADLVKQALVEKLAGEARKGFDYTALRRIYADAVKEVVYDPKVKAEVIETATTKAAKEIRAKGMKQIFSKVMEVDE